MKYKAGVARDQRMTVFLNIASTSTTAADLLLANKAYKGRPKVTSSLEKSFLFNTKQKFKLMNETKTAQRKMSHQPYSQAQNSDPRISHRIQSATPKKKLFTFNSSATSKEEKKKKEKKKDARKTNQSVPSISNTMPFNGGAPSRLATAGSSGAKRFAARLASVIWRRMNEAEGNFGVIRRVTRRMVKGE